MDLLAGVPLKTWNIRKCDQSRGQNINNPQISVRLGSSGRQVPSVSHAMNSRVPIGFRVWGYREDAPGN